MSFIRANWKSLVAIIVLVGIIGLGTQTTRRDDKYASDGMSPGYDAMSRSGEYAGNYTDSYEESAAVEAPMATMDMAISNQKMIAPDMLMPFPAPVDQGIADADRMIIRTSNLTIKVETPEETFEQVKAYVASVDGFIESADISEVYSYGYERMDTGTATGTATGKQKQVFATIRVPDERFDETLQAFRAYGYVSAENVGGQDVTASYRDTEMQLENLRAREAKLMEFYDQAENVEETMMVFTELENIRSQIEYLETQNRNLDRQTTYATIYLSLVPEETIQPFTDGDWSIGQVWKQAVNQLSDTLRGIAEVVVGIAVYAIIWVPALLIAWIVYRMLHKQRDITQ